MGRRSRLQSTQLDRDAKQVIESGRHTTSVLAARISGLETLSSGRRFLFSSSQMVSVVASAVETELSSVVLNGGILGASGILEIIAFMKVINYSVAVYTITPRIYYGARILSLGPINIAQTVGSLLQLRAFVVGAGGSTTQSVFGTIYLSQPYGNFTSVNALEGANGLQFDTDSEEDQLLKLTIQHNSADPLLSTTSLITLFGYPIAAEG